MVHYKNTDPNAKKLTGCGHGVKERPMESLSEYGRHFHESCEMFLFISGDFHYNIDGNSYILQPYDLLLIPPSTYHFAIPMSNENYENYVININVPFAENSRLQRLFSPPYVINIAGDGMLRRMFSLLDHYFENYSEEDFKEASEHLIDEMLICLSYKKKDDKESDSVTVGDTLIAKITAYISENIYEDLHADSIAKHLNFSRSYIQNRFSEFMGIGLKQYINQKKVYAAHTDIQAGELPFRVAEKYGFSDYSSFYRHYKRVFGTSPKEAQKKN